MSKTRRLNTHYWDDGYVIKLDPSEKLLFLYYLSSPLSNLCGIYEVNISRIAFDTGLHEDVVISLNNRFEKDKKIKWDNGWVAIKNFIKHQKYNANMMIAVDREFDLAPHALVEWVRIPNDSESFPKGSESYPNMTISKNKDKSIDKNKNKRFTPPSIREIQDYLNERRISDIDPETFHAFYESKGWRVGNTPMKSWKAAVTTWVKRGVKKRTGGQVSRTTQNVIAFVKGNQDDSNDIR